MEEAPRGTFQDELEWCISQLETGLLRLNPTPEQAEESQRILRVLRSHKAPLVKKRQVMHQVFGDYRLKMTKELKRTAEAVAKSEKVQIQPGDSSTSGSVVYRKQSSQPSDAPSWFMPSDSSFQFSFVLPERTSEEINRSTDEANGVDSSREQSAGNVPPTLEGQQETLYFSTGKQGTGFAFNFIISDDLLPPLAAADTSLEDASREVADVVEAATERDALLIKTTAMLENSVSPEPDRLDAVSAGGQRDDESPVLKAVQGIREKKETTHEDTNSSAASGSSKRKKRKKQPSGAEPRKTVNEHRSLHVKASSGQTEMCQQSDEQMKREVDWCVEQLELGLKTQKSTPKQVDEALRAIRTLCSEKAVLAKKRQIMRLMFGDYRKKMAEEQQKQLKLMQAASKAARITEVTEDACRKSSQVFRKSVEETGRSQSPKDPLLRLPRADDTCSFTFTPSQEEFCFNFF